MSARRFPVQPRRRPTGRVIDFPACGEWACDDDSDWEPVGPEDETYSSVKREHDIVRYHQPRDQWRERLQRERDRLNDGKPLWVRY